MSTATLSKPGTLIHARGREWVVLPDSTDDLLMARPVGGLDEEVAGILPAVESVASATFRLPTAADLGDFTAGQLLRDAARLSARVAPKTSCSSAPSASSSTRPTAARWPVASGVVGSSASTCCVVWRQTRRGISCASRLHPTAAMKRRSARC